MQWANYNGFPSNTSTLLSAMKEMLPQSQLVYTPACGAIDGITYNSLFGQCSINDKKGFEATYWNNKDFEGKAAANVQISTPFHFTTMGATAFTAGVNISDVSAI